MEGEKSLILTDTPIKTQLEEYKIKQDRKRNSKPRKQSIKADKKCKIQKEKQSPDLNENSETGESDADLAEPLSADSTAKWIWMMVNIKQWFHAREIHKQELMCL